MSDLVGVPPELVDLLRAGKLDKKCPACGLVEAASWYCSKCLTPTGPADWFRPVATAAQIRALEAARAKSRAKAGNGALLEKTAKSAAVAVGVGPTPRLSAAPDGPHTPDSVT